MKVASVKLVYDRKKTASKQNRAAVELLITFERKKKYMNTGVKVLPQNWKDAKIVNLPDAEELNDSLDILLRDVRKVLNDMYKSGCVCLDEIPSMLKRMKNEGMTFLQFCEERMLVRQHGITEDSKERYERFMRFFRDWGKIKWFSDISDSKIVELDKVLDAKGLKPYSKWNNYHRFLNSFIIDAIDEGRIRRNPYRYVKIDKEKSKGGIGKYLTKEEFDAIKSLSNLTESMERVRDLFVFQTYTCTAYTDLASFNPDLIEEDKKGRKIYVANRGKTDVEFTLLVLPDALRILEKYDGKLPIISNVKYNEYLKVLAQAAGIDKPISSHWARHTGATLLLNAGVEMEIVAKILGHSSTKITRAVYAKLLDSTVADAMESISSKF
jgi:site-specific recombinase XerD